MTMTPRVKWDFTYPNAMANPVKDLSGNNLHLYMANAANTVNGQDGTLLNPSKFTYLYRSRSGGLPVIPTDGPFYIKIQFIPYNYNGTMYLLNTGMESGSYKTGDTTYINITIESDGSVNYIHRVFGTIEAVTMRTSDKVKYNEMNTLIINDEGKRLGKVRVILNGNSITDVRSSGISSTGGTGEYEQSQFLIGTSQPSYAARYSGYIKSIETGLGEVPLYKFLLQSEDKLYYINSDGNISECGTINDPDISQYFESYGSSSLPELYKSLQPKLDRPYKLVMVDYNK